MVVMHKTNGQKAVPVVKISVAKKPLIPKNNEKSLLVGVSNDQGKFYTNPV